MNWNESHEFVNKLNKKERKRYRELVYKFLDIPVDGHEAHLSACQELEKELQKGEPIP